MTSDTYARPAEPLDRAAFQWRRQQRSVARASMAARAKPPTGGTFAFFVQRDLRDAEEHQRRQETPVLQAQLHLQRRGWRVYRGAGGWVCGSKPERLSDDELMAMATRHGWTGASEGIDG